MAGGQQSAVRQVLNETLEAYGKLETLIDEDVRQDAIEDILLVVRRSIEAASSGRGRLLDARTLNKNIFC